MANVLEKLQKDIQRAKNKAATTLRKQQKAEIQAEIDQYDEMLAKLYKATMHYSTLRKDAVARKRETMNITVELPQ